ILFWILGIIGILIVGGGVYAYTVYSNVSNTLDAVHKPLDREKSEKREQKVDISDKKPISILMMGVDQRGEDQGRSDSLMLFTLNPKTKSMKIISIPRDSYTEI
ncbi:LCP family glycopolymer transferase, partial [Bacillus pseudomycoides]